MTLAGWSLKRWAALGVMALALLLGLVRGPRLVPCRPCPRCEDTGGLSVMDAIFPERHLPCVVPTFGDGLRHLQAVGLHEVRLRRGDATYRLSDLAQVVLFLVVLGIWLVDPLLFPVQAPPGTRREAIGQRAHRVAWIRWRRRLRTAAAATALFLILLLLQASPPPPLTPVSCLLSPDF